MNQIGLIASGMLEYDFSFITDETEKSSELLTVSGSLGGRIGDLNLLINKEINETIEVLPTGRITINYSYIY